MALDYAAKIVGLGGRITLLMVVEAPQYPGYPGTPSSTPPMVGYSSQEFSDLRESMMSGARDYLHTIASRLQDQVAKIDILINMDMPPGKAIIHSAHDVHASAIVMSTHGRSGISRLLMGSVTQRVLSEAPCPVLVVPGHLMEEEAE
jgi:nucleotide-binding universal stress UspA family protein